MDGYVQAPVPQQTLEPISFDMTKPPKWLKRPVGASFGVSQFYSKHNNTTIFDDAVFEYYISW